ncbi:hypothetical protein Tco_0652664 [Tanacetum coccineum]|uniref:Uncharacterized protein n=1 Tax=Tanacetum coccineum TaxID=301880 RepID=A0ABQ4WYY9_9ASTR
MSTTKASSGFRLLQRQDAAHEMHMRMVLNEDEEQLLFLTGELCHHFDDDIFEADQCDAFDSDVDEAPTTHTIFMANLSSEDPIYDEAGTSYDSNTQFEVQDHDTFVDHNETSIAAPQNEDLEASHSKQLCASMPPRNSVKNKISCSLVQRVSDLDVDTTPALPTPTQIGDLKFQTLQIRLFSSAGGTDHPLVSGLRLFKTRFRGRNGRLFERISLRTASLKCLAPPMLKELEHSSQASVFIVKRHYRQISSKPTLLNVTKASAGISSGPDLSIDKRGHRLSGECCSKFNVLGAEDWKSVSRVLERQKEAKEPNLHELFTKSAECSPLEDHLKMEMEIPYSSIIKFITACSYSNDTFEDIMKAQVSVFKASVTLNIQAFKIKKSVSISFRMTQVHKTAKDHMMMIRDYDWMMISKKLKDHIQVKLKPKSLKFTTSDSQDTDQ